jgi:crotonobetainyl-CoA:carnitine CoA-transferase CaiB-like acyl-CoA transferase
MGPPFSQAESAALRAVNRNQRGMVIDLQDEPAAALLRRLAQRADVLVENFRPGTLDELGLGYAALRASAPGLVYCSISGFGATGPYRERGGFDLIAQGMSGLMSITGEPDRPPVKVGVPIDDLNAGLLAAYAILAAYIHRLRTGRGQHIDTSLLEAGIATTFWESAVYFATGAPPGPMGSAHRLAAPYQAFKTADGYINVGAANQRNWELLCRALDRADLLGDERFASNAARMEHLAELRDCLGSMFAEYPGHEWLRRLEAAGVPSGPIYTIPDVYADPHVQAREMVVEHEHPSAGMIKNIGIPVKLSETPGAIRRAAPRFGEHTDAVLRECGLSDREIDELREARVTR